jgi:DNA invertase Pin-like site-specific DNA recombinase
MRVAIYVRCSTDEQDVTNQLLQLREFAQRQGWQIIREFSDSGVSGKTGDRPELKAMFEAASKRKFDVLLFWSLDRLTREGVLATLQYLNRLTAYGVAWRSYQEQYIDSIGPFGEAVVGILAAVAKQERLRMSERTRAGLAKARARGRHIGRPTLAVDVSRVRARVAAGESLRVIARDLKCSAALLCKRLAASAQVTA